MNLAIIEDGVLVTPPADDILEGCTVRRAMELIVECGVLSHLGVTDARYEDVEIDRAKAADEVMVSLFLLSYGQF
jgi:branched-subunit amino acid aminotransferase/4-amino-4-deoxychorismate lyase